ncbi:SUMF1/EgtB/PvdO family nonheme iron enzyme [Treponema berlinense]|uniref:SUMF1/EgtB/PvdO family nonheme iron enzyme n=1 Tax=Treponema berlinense TaxID=225004 RepID=UPI002354A9BD|nr:SUMF1/EgtB/PvdO family nonheme iron enzyme [Treponema berlinense]
MKKTRIFAVLAAMTMGLAVFGCKAETETEYEDKVYAEAVTFTAEDAGDAGVKVAMATKTEGAAIYYTVDKSSESLKYSEPLTFSKDTEIKAFAVKKGIENSPISVAKVSIKTKTITEKVYVCAKCQKEYKTAQEAIDCCAETLDTTAPADVTEPVATAKDSSVVLTWKDATDEDIFCCLVSWKAESTGRALVALEKDSLIAAKGQQGCVVTGLTNGTKYTFTVKTMDTSGNTSGGVTVKATPVAVDSKEPLKIDLSVPPEKSNTAITITANITTAAQSVDRVVYKKDGTEVASKLLADSSAIPAEKDNTDNKQWTFEITAADETANGTYTVAALDSDGREEAAQITIDNFDFTPPAKVKGITATYSSEPKEITLKWTNPADSDFNHVEISYTFTDITGDSVKSKPEVVTGTEKTFEGIDGNKIRYTYYIASVDKLGNKSNEVKYNVSVNKTVSNVPDVFVKIPAASIKGTETWTPESKVFVRGHKLEIASFYMSDHPVTRGEYKTLMGKDPSSASAYDKDGNKLTGDAVKNNPVNYINWYDALVYCNTRSINEGLTPCYAIGGKTDPKDWGSVPSSSNSTWNAATCDFTADGYRLPTEAEWEWAARGGESYTYAGSDDIDEVAWYTSNTNDTGTRDVKTKKANGYGLYDMSGNVWEWCWDWYDWNISSGTPDAGPASGSDRCLRGGSWLISANYAQVAGRGSDFYPNYRYNDFGFRLVRNAN